MKLTSTALGLAAVGAGLLAARILLNRREHGPQTPPEPPSPEQLIGHPHAEIPAREASRAFPPPGSPPV